MSYVAQSDLTNVGLPATALGTLTPQQIAAVLQNASDFADSFFRARYGQTGVPLAAWDSAVTYAVARIAAYRLILLRGYNPNSGSDSAFRQGYEDAVKWLGMVQRQQAHPLVTIAGAAQAPQQPNLSSQSIAAVITGETAPTRGW